MKKPKKVKNGPQRAKRIGEKRQKRAKISHLKKLKRKEAIRLEKVRKEQKFREYVSNLTGK